MDSSSSELEEEDSENVTMSVFIDINLAFSVAIILLKS